MKPFNLERALAGDPVVTRDGRKVEEVTMLKKADVQKKVIAVIDGYIRSYYPHGTRQGDQSMILSHDLFMAPVKKTYYTNVYSRVNPLTGQLHVWTGKTCESEEEAMERLGGDHRAQPYYRKTITFEIEE